MSIAIVKKHDCDFDVEDLLRRSSEAQKLYNSSEILQKHMRRSEEVWLGLYNDRVACVWGLAPVTTISNRALMWLLTTDLVEQHKFLFVRHSQLAIEEALIRYEIITGHVRVGNDAARKWLRWLGAKIEPPENGYSIFTIRRKR